jgi:hypothetical protein
MAPVLCFTAEEIWQLQTGDGEESVMLHTWQPLPAPAAEGRTARQVAQATRLPRRAVMRALEELRIEGRIGSSLQAEVTHPLRRRKVRTARLARRRPALRLHLLADDADSRRRGAAALCRRWRTPSASAAGTSRRRRGRTPSTRVSAAAASTTCTAKAKPVPSRNIDRWLWLAGIIVVLDQVSKWLVLAWLQPGDSIYVAPSSTGC